MKPTQLQVSTGSIIQSLLILLVCLLGLSTWSVVQGAGRVSRPEDPWRWCFLCTSSGPDTLCETDPAAIRGLANHINCSRPYCTVKRLEHGDFVQSFSRGCQPIDFGNACISAHGGQQRTCYTTCMTSWCNSGPGLPIAKSKSRGRRSAADYLHHKTMPITCISISLVTIYLTSLYRRVR